MASKLYLSVNIYSNFQVMYLLSLYLNNQVNNIIIILTVLTLFMYKYPKSTHVLIVWYYTLFSLNFIGISSLEEWPTALLIGLNSIHPYIYYIGFTLITMSTFKNIFFSQWIKLINLLVTISFALLLGMYWGGANDIWSFFWVNDLIELVLINLVIFVILIIHTYGLNANTLYISLYICVLVMLYAVRFNLFSSRHSFFLELQIVSYPLYCYMVLVTFSVCYIVSTIILMLSLFYIGHISWVYIIGYYLQLIVVKTSILNRLLLFIHVFLLTVLCIWIFNCTNYNLFYLYIQNLYQTKILVLTNSTLLTPQILVCTSILKHSCISILNLLVNQVYLYKINVDTVVSLMSYGLVFINLSLFILLKKLYKCSK